MKLINYISFIFILLQLCSCNDAFMQRDPLDELTDPTYWKTETHLKLAANACINYLRDKGQMVDMEYMADNVYRERSSSYKTIGSGAFTNDLSLINSEWATDYDGIRRCNHLLENYTRVSAVSESVRLRYAAEARFMRAYNYIYLVNFFGSVPKIEKTLDIGDPELYGSRVDKEAMVDWVIDELNAAATDLPPAREVVVAEFGRPTKEMAWAFCSRFALYHARWDAAINAAEAVMNSGFHELYSNGNPTTSYYELFTYAGRASRNSKNKEVIAARIYSEEAKAMHNWSRELHVPNEETRCAPSRSLVDAYLCNGLPITHPMSRYRENNYEALFENRDPRLAQTVLKPGARWGGYPGKPVYVQPKFSNSASSCRTPTGWYFTKFVEIPMVTRQGKDENDIPLMRYAEVLLNWIEAKESRGDAITQGDIDKSINKLRERVDAPRMILANLSLYGLSLRDEIRRERRVELALEGERYFDILRWEQGDLLASDVTGMRKANVPASEYPYVKDIPTDANGNMIMMTGRLFDAPKNYLWPVPYIQTQRNTNLLPNNSGW